MKPVTLLLGGRSEKDSEACRLLQAAAIPFEVVSSDEGPTVLVGLEEWSGIEEIKAFIEAAERSQREEKKRDEKR